MPIAHLDALGVPHSPIITASSGYAMGFLDPDGIQIRLYAADDKVRRERVDADNITRNATPRTSKSSTSPPADRLICGSLSRQLDR